MGRFIIAYVVTKLDAVYFDGKVINYLPRYENLRIQDVGSVILAIKPILSRAKNDTFVVLYSNYGVSVLLCGIEKQICVSLRTTKIIK
jgi:hypothetical protein